MHIDFREAGQSEHRAEICVIGAGVAGISIARRLLDAGHSVTILESGGFDYEADIADLNAGPSVGEEYYELDHARLRMFGGTTAIWGGRVAELDPIDFRKRAWIRHSGWPIGYHDLRPYYDQAYASFDLPAGMPTANDFQSAGLRLPDFDEARLGIRSWAFDRRYNRFTYRSCQDLVDHERCTIFTHATVAEIEVSDDTGRVTGLQVRDVRGKAMRVVARMFVLASGGIENPRILLASRAVMASGIGNGHDLVGRFFMEHPHARGGRIVASRTWDLLKAFGRRHSIGGVTAAALLVQGEKYQASEQSLNTSLTIAPRQGADKVQFWAMRAYNRIKHDLAPSKGARAAWMSVKRTAATVQSAIDPLRPWLLNRLGYLELALLVRSEQAPNPDSRVQLADEADELGVPRAKLDWRLNELDIHSVERLVAAVGTEFERLDLGRVEPASWLSGDDRRWQTDKLVSAHPIGGYHHMGTTRMADDPRHGVTDAFGRVHGIANLYIAGSSLFPTSGWANPTLTIVALALRSGDHIAQRLAANDAPPAS
ncbi:MAG: GMC family oxidoreductase [Caenibius sp.]